MQDNGTVELLGNLFCPDRIVLNQFDVVMGLFEGLCEPQPDITCASEHNAAAGLFYRAKLAHDRLYIFAGSQKKYLVTCLNNSVAFRGDRPILTVDCSNTGVHVGQVFA